MDTNMSQEASHAKKVFTKYAKPFAILGIALLAILVILFGLKAFGEARALQYIGMEHEPQATISVSGEGEETAKPDTAELTATITEEADAVSTAQDAVTEKVDAVLNYLSEQDIPEEDIRTTQYRINPRYEHRSQVNCREGFCPPGGERVLVGYEVHQTLSIKVEEIDKAGTIIGGLGDREVSNISGPRFTIEDEEALKESAREKAIAQAKEKARGIAEDLGVSLSRIVNYQESGSPIYQAEFSADAAVPEGRGGGTPQLPAGENTITSNVTITYEIR